MSRTTRRLSAAVAAVALGATALMGVAVSAASAAPSNIDPNQTGSLTIHKLSQPATPGAAGDGSEVAPGVLPADALPINGVEFSVSQVTQIGGATIDLTTDAGWAAIQSYLNDPATLPAGAALGSARTQTTANGGVAVFNTLPVGLYWVTESAQPAGVPAGQSFLVTIPMPTQDPGAFRYDVHAYPKSALDPSVPYAVKTVDDAAAHAIGDKVTWKISARVPDSAGYNVTSFQVDEQPVGEWMARWDPTKVWGSHLGNGAQFPDSATVTPKSGGTPVALDRVDLEPGVGSPSATGLSIPGLTKVQNAGPGAVIEFVYEAKVTSVPADGVIRNRAVVTMNTTDMHVSADTLWGTARLNKYVAGDTSKRLADAKFQVFETRAKADAAAAQVTAGQAVTGGLVFGPGAGADSDTKTFTTKDQGADHGFAVIGGLKASATGTKYWVVETAAPAGYVASVAPIEITVYPGTDLSGAGSTVNIPNAQRAAGALPVLGGAGMTAIGIGGAILIAGGVLFAIFGRRKKNENTTAA